MYSTFFQVENPNGCTIQPAQAVGGYGLDLDDELEWEVDEGRDEGLESQWVERFLETVLQLWGRLRKHFRMPR